VSWQLCPLCRGSGNDDAFPEEDRDRTYLQCRVCWGTGVLNEQTGARRGDAVPPTIFIKDLLAGIKAEIERLKRLR
jgi:hypothetical protein